MKVLTRERREISVGDAVQGVGFRGPSPTRWRSGTESLEGVEIIGELREDPARTVLRHTQFFGGIRVIDMLGGDPLPRIC